jgi:riboflavin synthase
VSLTVARLDRALVGVSLIPTTIADTTLGSLQVGDRVNIEVDVLAKYVEKMLGERG